MAVKPTGKISARLIKRYSPHAEVMIREQIPNNLVKTRELLSLSHEVEMLGAFFAHIRLKDHTEGVTDFKGEFSQALEDRGIESILEIGVSAFSFVRYFSHITPPKTKVFLFGKELFAASKNDKIISGKGNLIHNFHEWFPKLSFDMIFALGVPEYALLAFPMIDFEDQITQANQSAIAVTNRLSDNPYASFFVSSLKSGYLAFVKSELVRGVNIDFWRGRRTRMISSWLDIYRNRYKSLPASLAILSKKAQTKLKF